MRMFFRCRVLFCNNFAFGPHVNHQVLVPVIFCDDCARLFLSSLNFDLLIFKKVIYTLYVISSAETFNFFSRISHSVV